MQKLSFSAFDFFSYAFPGVCILFSFFILDPSLNGSGDILAKADAFGLGAAVLITVVGYLTGFAVSPIGRWLYKTVGFRLWKHSFTNLEGYSVSEKYALIRQYSQENFKYVETWNVLCAMSHNLAIACIFAIVNIILRLSIYGGSLLFWLPLIAMSLLLLLLFLHRAVVFYRWSAIDINAAIKVLKLGEE